MDNKPKVTEDLDYMADIKAAVLATRTPYAHLLVYLLVGFLAFFIIWASLAEVDESALGLGKVIPSSQIKHIQSLEGGIVQTIFVKEGEMVEKDQKLLQLDDTRFSSSYREAQSKYFVYLASIARLTAEVTGKDHIDFPAELIPNHQDLVDRELKLFESRKNTLDTALGMLQHNYELVKKELDLTRPLVDEGLISQIDLLRLQREVNELESNLREKRDKFTEEAQTELNKNKAELAGLQEGLVSEKDRVTRAVIKSPVHGTVKEIYVSTIGQVVKPGENILEVVPINDTLLVQARFSPSDIGFLHVGQSASVKVTAFDYSIYGGLKGTVEYIGADSLIDEKGNSYYEVLVRTDKNHIDYKGRRLSIMPGMTANVNIMTGKKTVLNYILKPILKAKYNALHER